MPKIDRTLAPAEVVALGPKHTPLEAELLSALKLMCSTFTHDSACSYYYGPVRKNRCNCARRAAVAAIARAEQPQ